MKISNHDLINYLEKQPSWVDGSIIANYFSISLKSTFNYIKRINDYCPELIISSNKGYLINKKISYDKKSLFFNDSYDNRINHILKQLLTNSKSDVDIYEIADELFISDSYVENLLKQVKLILNKGNLDLFRKRNKIKIIGKEVDIRRFAMEAASKEKADNGMVTEFAFDDVDTRDLMSRLLDIFQKYKINTNDYCFNTICLYIHISINRIIGGHIITEDTPDFSSTKSLYLFHEIKQYLENSYRIEINKSEFYYISTIVSKNTYLYDDKSINYDNLYRYLNKTIIDKVEQSLNNLEFLYSLVPFKKENITELIIHLHLLSQRVSSNFTLKNPLLRKIKESNILYYDMSAFLISNTFGSYVDLTKIEDELCFLSLQLGKIFDKGDSKINCCFIYADYQRIYKKLLDFISVKFSDILNITNICSFRNTDDANYDLIITNYPPVRKLSIPYILVDDMQIVTNTFQSRLSNDIYTFVEEQKQKKYVTSLLKFKSEDLFNPCSNYSSKKDALTSMCTVAFEKGYCSSNITNIVINDFTSNLSIFNNIIVVPHIISDSCKKSFISLSINKKPISWSESKVNFVILICSNREDIDDYKLIINNLISTLCLPSTIQKLPTINSYEDFYKILTDELF